MEGSILGKDFERERAGSVFYTQLLDVDQVPLWQDIGSRHHVVINPIVEAGVQYSTQYQDSKGQTKVYQGTVPEGRVLVAVNSAIGYLSGFWKEINQVNSKETNSTP